MYHKHDCDQRRPHAGQVPAQSSATTCLAASYTIMNAKMLPDRDYRGTRILYRDVFGGILHDYDRQASWGLDFRTPQGVLIDAADEDMVAAPVSD